MSKKRSAMQELAQRALGEMAKGGRPRAYETPQELAAEIRNYFDWAEEEGEPITMSGMAVFCGICRETLWKYGQRSAFRNVVKRAREVVVASYERRLDRDKAAGSIFAMKNIAGWSDRQTITSTSIVNRIDWSRVSDEQLRRVKAGEPAIAVLGSGIKELLLPEPTEGPAVEEGVEIVQGAPSTSGTERG